MEITKTFTPLRPGQWRAWLRKNHAKTGEIWLVYHKKHTGKPRVSYNDAVDEAMCFGWIDSTVKTLDRDRFCQRFTPRRPGSPVSEMNKARARRMIRLGKMTSAGMASLKAGLGAGDRIHPRGIRPAEPWTVPADIREAIQKDPLILRNFRKFPISYIRIRVAYIAGARHRPEEFKRRLGNFLRMTAKNKRFGMVQG